VSYPVFPEKVTRPALLSAARMIEFRRTHGGLGESRGPDGVVLCLYAGLLKRFAWRYRSRRVHGFLGDLYLLERYQRRVGVMGNFGIGAPATANVAEELIAFGATRLVILSLAGGLRPELAPGSVIVCDRAIRDEGTSYHYLAAARDVRASVDLVSSLSQALDGRGLSHTIGATWSTDAPYRETKDEAERFAAEGVAAVDMESAGLFAAGQVRGVRTASVLVVGDSLAGPRWSAPPDMGSLHARLKLVLDTLIEVLRPSD
jgi:uridine phosphorylase